MTNQIEIYGTTISFPSRRNIQRKYAGRWNEAMTFRVDRSMVESLLEKLTIDCIADSAAPVLIHLSNLDVPPMNGTFEVSPIYQDHCDGTVTLRVLRY